MAVPTAHHLTEGNVKILPEFVTSDRTQVVVSTVVGVHGKDNPVPYRIYDQTG